MISFYVHYDVDPNFLSDACTAAEKILTVQAMKDTSIYVPAETMSLAQRTHIIGNHIVYPGPYARYLYAGKAMVDSATGKGPMKIPDVGYRWHRGATLRPTDRNLNISTAVNPKAQAQWFEASKRDNIEKWKRVAAQAIEEYA